MMNSIVTQVQEQLAAGQRLSKEQALDLWQQADLLQLGHLARDVNARRNGQRVYFNCNRHINYTNICVNQCRFCAFCKKAADPEGYTLAISDILAKASEARRSGARELHMVGGLHPDLPFDFYLRMLASLKANFSEMALKAFTAVEVDYFARISGQQVQEVIAHLQRVGLDTVPGGGAEILVAAPRHQICPEKISAERWLEVTEAIHEAGLKSNATMLFGHMESLEDRVEHLEKLRQLQDRTGGFLAFIPLAFQPDNTRLPGIPGPDGVDCLKTLAMSRLFLDNFQHIKAYWVMLGVKLAQTSLHFGVNDLDGTVVEEHIGHDAGADSPQVLDKQELIRQIQAAGRQPVERDSLYNEVQSYESVVGH